MIITQDEIRRFQSGNFDYCYKRFGSHIEECEIVNGENIIGVRFTLWAPNAHHVSVIGDFNNWDKDKNALFEIDNSGIWSAFIPDAKIGDLYKYFIVGAEDFQCEKSDPFAFQTELRPRTASIVYNIDKQFEWHDNDWLKKRTEQNPKEQPISIYEMHIASWMNLQTPPEFVMNQNYIGNQQDNSLQIITDIAEVRHEQQILSTDAKPSITYRQLAEILPKYLHYTGFTHVEFMPVMEYPFDGSWGYQLTGYFAPSSRFGTPDDFKYLIDKLHEYNIGIILDIVPAHFAVDGHGLVFFDGTHLYEHADMRKGFHPDWGTYIFNFGRYEVANFLISHALFWLREYHVDGLRLDAVASMLYLDYSRKAGEWLPNEFGGNENLEAIAFIKQLNDTIRREFKNVLMFAEESTAWANVSRKTQDGGLGFHLKWNMGWMTDVLNYIREDPIYRLHHHDKLTFSMFYAYSEDFVLPFSHDEVVHGKGSLLRKFPGHNNQKFAGLRGMLGYTYGHPGKKLLFMGTEFAEWDEWWFQRPLNWNLLNESFNRGVFNWVRDLNYFIQDNPAMFELDFSPDGFEWIDCNNAAQNIVSFVRYTKDKYANPIIVISNFSPITHYNYRLGVPLCCDWDEALNSDLAYYAGTGLGNPDIIKITDIAWHNQEQSIELTIPALATLMLKVRN